MIDYLRRPIRFDYLAPYLSRGGETILDVGCGNHSPSLTKRFFPRIEYHGLDLVPNYNNDDADLRAMARFFQADLDRSLLDDIPNGWYDCIICSHVVEHLHDGEQAIARLLRKLKPGGVMYIETPTPRSLHLPSMPGTLNFWDDKTHVRVYPSEEIVRIVEANHCEVLRAGVRRSWKRISVFPAHLVYSLVTHGQVTGTVFWDVLGFAHVVIARRAVTGAAQEEFRGSLR